MTSGLLVHELLKAVSRLSPHRLDVDRSTTALPSKELYTALENLKQVFHLRRKLFATTVFEAVSSPEFSPPESARRHEENSAIIKEICASSNTANRNLEIATAKSDWNGIGRIAFYEYAVSNMMNSNVYPEPKQYIPFPKRLHDCTYNEVFEWKHTYLFDNTDQEESPPHKEKDPGSFTLPFFINDNCFEKSLADLGASVSIMPYSTYVNLRLGTLTKTYMTIELADRSIKHPKGIIENVLVKIRKFTFPVDSVVVDILEDKDVPLILGRPFLSTAHAKINVFKCKISLRVGNEKMVFESIKPASSIIKRVYMLSLRERMNLDLESRLMEGTLILNRSFDPLYGDYIELNDLNTPIELRRNQGVVLEPTVEDGEVDYEPLTFGKRKMFLPSLWIRMNRTLCDARPKVRCSDPYPLTKGLEACKGGAKDLIPSKW
nr:hypothetical protein [Tanacetum cinerariifolium]